MLRDVSFETCVTDMMVIETVILGKQVKVKERWALNSLLGVEDSLCDSRRPDF